MIWVAWRQQRAVLLSLAAYTVILIAAAVYTRWSLASAPELGTECRTSELCEIGSGYFGLIRAFFTLEQAARLGTFGFAALAGAFVGAPMFAREWEQRTHLLVLSQSISPARWFTTRAAVVFAATVLGAVLLSLVQWWTATAITDQSGWGLGLRPNQFEVQPVALIGYTLFAVALGITAGLVLRRTLPAMAVTLFGAVGAVYAVRVFVRPNYMTPVVSHDTYGPSGPTYEAYLADPGRWSVWQGFTDLDGKVMADSTTGYEARSICRKVPDGPSDPAYQECLAENGVGGTAHLVHPGDRFWPFQFIEFGLFAAAAGVLIALSLWWLRKRAV